MVLQCSGDGTKVPPARNNPWSEFLNPAPERQPAWAKARGLSPSRRGRWLCMRKARQLDSNSLWGGKRMPRLGSGLEVHHDSKGRAYPFAGPSTGKQPPSGGALAARSRYLRAANSPTSELTPEHRCWHFTASRSRGTGGARPPSVSDGCREPRTPRWQVSC